METGIVAEPAANRRVYVSITGLELKSIWHAFQFWRHAIPSMIQVRKAAGCLRSEVRSIDGIKHTLTVWESEADMRRFLYSGAHRRAIRAFPSFATGKTCGFWTERVPGWDEVPEIWRKKGRAYGEPRTSGIAETAAEPPSRMT